MKHTTLPKVIAITALALSAPFAAAQETSPNSTPPVAAEVESVTLEGLVDLAEANGIIAPRIFGRFFGSRDLRTLLLSDRSTLSFRRARSLSALEIIVARTLGVQVIEGSTIGDLTQG